MATINEMRQVATQIENETQVGGNTAGRVGGLLNDIVDKLEDDETDINIVKRVEITYKQCQIPNKYINDTNIGSALSLQSNNDYGVFYFFVRKGQSFAISSTYVAPSASRLYIFHLDEDLDIVQRYENVVVGTTTYTATEDCIVVGTLYGNDSVQYTGIQKAYLVNGKMNEVGLTGANIIQHLKDLEADIDNDITNLNTEVGSLEDEVFGTPSVSNLPLPNDGVLNANGTISLYEDWYNSDYFAVDSAKQYTYNGSIYGGGNILYYDSAKNLLGACSNIPVNYADRTNPVKLNDMPSNAAYIRVSGYDISACSITESDSLRPKVENIEERINDLIKPQGIIEPVFGATLANPVRIKLLGDSITQGWGGSNFDQDGAEIYPLGEGWQTHRNLHGYCWANMMRDYLETKYHCTVVNNAITGTSTRNIVTRLDDFIDAADDIVICAYGTNNRNNYDGNNTEWNSFVPDLFTIVNYCKERNKTIILVANIPASSSNEQSTNNGHAKSAHMNDVHDAVLYVAESTGVECVDMYDAFNDYCINTNTPLGVLLGDGLHPNDYGYDVYYSLIMPRIGVAIESAAESGGVIDGNSTTIKVRRNTAAGFTSSNPVLADGELGFETDQKRYKMGDGVTAWNSLEYRSEELDATPTQGSEKGVMSGGVYNALEPFNDLLYEKYDVQITDGTTYNNLIIDTTPNPNIFITGAGSQYKGVLIPVVRGFTYVLEYSATQYTGVALIKNSAPAAGDAVIYATGETNHYDSPTAGGIRYVYEITEDNLFLYVRNDTGNVARTWPATFYRYNEDSKNVLMKEDVQHNVTESSSAVVDSAGIYRFVKNNASLQPSDALQMTKTPFNLSQFTWANIKVGGASDSKRVRSSIVAIPSNTKSIKLTLASTGTYGYQIFVFMTNAYSEPYYTIADWEGTSDNITLEVPECVGEGAYMCIYGHRIDNTNVSTSGFSSNIESLNFYTIQQRDIISAKKKSIRILFLGNSLTQDAVAWLPYVLQNGEVDVDYSLIDLYNGGFTLAQQWSAIQSKTVFEIASVCQNVIGWTNYNQSKTLDDILDEYQFDILVLQEYFNYQTEPDLTAFENIVSYITERSSCPFEVVSLIHAPLRSDATNVYNRTVAGNQAILNGTCCSSLMNPGTAIYDALSTDLDSLGTRGHLSPDGTHAQEGLPCVLQSLNLLGWIYKKLGIAAGVVNFPMSTDMSTIYSSLHIPGANGAVVGGNFEQRELATKVAAASIRKLQKIELGLS